MKLRLRDLMKFMAVSESTIVRWITSRGLPNRQILGQHHFNPDELLEWAIANRVEVSSAMFEELLCLDGSAPKLAAALEAGTIVYGLQPPHGDRRNLPDGHRDRVLQALVRVLPLRDVTYPDHLLRLIRARGASAYAVIGEGMAISHLRNPIILPVGSAAITLCYLEQPVEFGDPASEAVQIMFTLTCPTMKTHLRLIARLWYALHDAKFKEVILGQGSPQQILGEARRIDGILSASSLGGHLAA
jgi:PTS system nitrogen regulatory IIA component